MVEYERERQRESERERERERERDRERERARERTVREMERRRKTERERDRERERAHAFIKDTVETTEFNFMFSYFRGRVGSYFGYSVAQHQILTDDRKK